MKPKNPFFQSNLDKKRIVKSQEDFRVEPESEKEAEEEAPLSKNSLFWFYFASLLVFLILFFRLFSLQILAKEFYKERAEENRLRIKITEAPRGIIYDRNRNALVKNVPSFSLEIYPTNLPTNKKERRELYEKLSSLLNLKIETFEKVEEKGLFYAEPIVLKEDLTREEALILESKLANLETVAIVKRPVREYLKTEAALSHLLGYTTRASTSASGKTGLEAFYEEYLRGKEGKQKIEVDSKGKLVRILAASEPELGNNLILSLDIGLQEVAAKALSSMIEKQKAKGGVALALDPQTGFILSFVSLPTFDNNLFSWKIKKEDYEKLLKDPQKPFFNRALQGLYPPGSTVKPMVAAAALKEGVINLKTTIYDKGFIEIRNIYNPSIVYRFPDWKAHGTVDLRKAIALSCDVYFYTIGGGYGQIKGLGEKKLLDWFSRFGLGQETGIDLFGEEKGFLPSPAWKKKVKKETWYQGDTYHLSIGQGDLLVTPIQMLEVLGALANGGTLYKPKLVSEITDPEGKTIKKFEPEIKNNQVVEKDILQVVREGMREAVLWGTAKALSDLNIEAGAKTGTAQNPSGPPSAWFMTFAPFENPQIAIVVLVEEGGEGHQAALPVAKEMLRYWFKK